jgi:Tyrosine phosphatase family
MRYPDRAGGTVVAGSWTWEAITVIRRIPFAGALNFRDIGGYPAGDAGRTRWGAVYRSDSLSFLTPDDLPAFDALGVKAMFQCLDLMVCWL